MESPLLQLQLLLPLAGCLAAALSALAVLLHDPRERSNQLATLLLAGGSWWGFCQVLWTAAPDPSTAYFWHHAAAPGWAFIGPLAIHLIAQHTDPPAWMRRVIAPTYVVGGVFMLMQFTTSWMHADAVPTPPGWGFEARSGHVWYLVFTFGCVIPTIGFALQRVRSAPSPAERSQIVLVASGIAAPFLLAGLTGGILPVLGIQVPRMGSISFGFLGVTIAWSYYRYGFSALATGHFSREILATLPNGLAFVSLDGRVLSGNERMAALLSVEMSALVGFPIEEALTASLTSPPQELREHECRLTPPGGDDVVVSVSTSLLLDKQDRPIGIVLVVRDLRELVELRNHLVTSGRLAAVGELAAGIAHEINNPIAFVRANLSQLQHDWRDIAKRLPEGEARADDGVDLVAEGEELLEECIDGVERTVRIVQDVKGFARAGSDDHEPVDLNDLLARMLRVAQPQIPYNVRVESRFGEIPKVMGAEPHLQQVFLNLVLNAYQAIEGEGAVVVETRVEDGAVVVAVSDDGAGIDPADSQRIFDPFFTTKPVGEGTGLGLAISFQIVQSHEGQISVTSEPGAGTTFQVRLPIPE